MDFLLSSTGILIMIIVIGVCLIVFNVYRYTFSVMLRKDTDRTLRDAAWYDIQANNADDYETVMANAKQSEKLKRRAAGYLDLLDGFDAPVPALAEQQPEQKPLDRPPADAPMGAIIEFSAYRNHPDEQKRNSWREYMKN